MISTSDFYVLGGTLPRDARSYAVRKADQDLLGGLRKGQFCYVLTSRQMGKSSLMVRTVTRLRQEKVTCLVIDLTAIGQNLTEDQWYDGLLNRVATDLDLEDELDDFWQEKGRLGPLQRWMHALRSVVLAKVSGPIVLFVDEIDAVRSLPFSADEFFAAIRECYNRRTEDKEFQRLTFCLLGVATPADLIRDTRSTPFNIGKRIELTDFTEAEAAPLAEGLRECGGDIQAQKLLARVLYWTHGHPYLTQRLCQAVVEAGVKSASGVDPICRNLFLTPGAQETDDNLLFVRERLLRAEHDPAGLLMLYAKVRAGKRVPNSETDPHITTLRLSGVVRVENGQLCVRNRIYSHVFDRDWIRTNLPGAEVRRQKTAFRRGVLSTAGVLGSILLLCLGGFLLTHYQRHLNMHVPLPDGTELIVHDVTYASDSDFQPGVFHWKTQMERNPLGPNPALWVWVSHNNRRTGKMESPRASEVLALDEHGKQFMPHVVLGGGSGTLSGYLFDTFPRRSKTIHLQFHSWYGSVIKDFEVPNPTPSLYPLWTPESLPCTKQIGDLAVTLKSVNWWPSDKGSKKRSFQELYGIQTQWTCQQADGSTTAWQADSIAISDATGNMSDDQVVRDRLSVYEPAWRFHIKFVRSPNAAVAKGETWTLKGVKMPGSGSVVLLTGSGNVNGVTLKPISLAVAAKVIYRANAEPETEGTLSQLGGRAITQSVTSDRMDITGRQPQVAVQVQGLKENQKLTLWATDSKGHLFIQSTLGANWTPNSNWEVPLYTRFLPIPLNTEKVDLHFSIQEIRTVDFMVRPPAPVAESTGK